MSKIPPWTPIDLGARIAEGSVHFALWSTRARRAAVRLFDGPLPIRDLPLESRGCGLFAARFESLPPDIGYKFVLDEATELPDPYARSLPHGVHGPARIVPSIRAPRSLPDARARVRRGIYELHVGTFTNEGTFASATERLGHLAALGVGALEILPVSSFPGRRGWGYDGVAHYAPYAGYGDPEDLRRLIQEAHRLGLAVLLDVVYNHFGPDGNYLASYSPEYFCDVQTSWGRAPDFATPQMRSFVLGNARMWFEEFGVDGLRLDATHAIHDGSRPHILRELADLAASFDPPRILIAEDERNDPNLVLESGMDAVWADDFHHQVRVLLTGEREGYFRAFEPRVADLARLIERGWLYEGQVSPLTQEPRGGDPTLLPPSALVTCVQNHDQIGNRALGTRLSHDAGEDALLAATALLLFLPMTPVMFMGQEWAASSPFLFFSDHEGELGEAVTRGRRLEFQAFSEFSDPERARSIPDPQAESTFLRSKLDWREIEAPNHARALAFHRRMLELRAGDPVIASASRQGLSCEARGQTLSVVRSSGPDLRLCVINFGDRAVSAFAPSSTDPVRWRLLCSTHDGDKIPPCGAGIYAAEPGLD